jgi:hypothetical protein
MKQRREERRKNDTNDSFAVFCHQNFFGLYSWAFLPKHYKRIALLPYVFAHSYSTRAYAEKIHARELTHIENTSA